MTDKLDLEEVAQRAAEVLRQHQRRRDEVISRPKNTIIMLAGDASLGGPDPGLLDALAEGILRVSGHGGLRNRARQEQIAHTLTETVQHALTALRDTLGEDVSTAELAAELSRLLQHELQAFLKDVWGEEYAELHHEAGRILAAHAAEALTGTDVAYA